MSEIFHIGTTSRRNAHSGQWTSRRRISNPPATNSNMTTIPCYVRTLRRQWGFTQKELADLIGRGGHERVADVELAKATPNAAEILTYSLLFGLPPADIFPALYEGVEERLIQAAYALDEDLKAEDTQRARNIRKLLKVALDRATGKARNPIKQ